MTTQTDFIEAQVGHVVLVTFQDGKQIMGTLVAHDTYTLRLQVKRDDRQVELLIYKHAIKHIATVG